MIYAGVCAVRRGIDAKTKNGLPPRAWKLWNLSNKVCIASWLLGPGKRLTGPQWAKWIHSGKPALVFTNFFEEWFHDATKTMEKNTNTYGVITVMPQSRVTLNTAGHLHTAVPHCSHSRAPIVHTAVPRENNEHGCVYLRCTAVCKLPGCVEGHPWQWGCCDMDNSLPAVVSFWLELVHFWHFYSFTLQLFFTRSLHGPYTPSVMLCADVISCNLTWGNIYISLIVIICTYFKR